MLRVNLYIAILGYMGAIAVFLIGIWLWIEFRAQSGNLGGTGAVQRKWRCDYCGYMYLGTGEEDVSQCPRCDSYNKV